MRIHFDARELYFLPQYVPVYRVLRKRGVDCTFVAYHNRRSEEMGIRRGFDQTGIPVVWCRTREDGLAFYRHEEPDWIVFGRSYGYLSELPPRTRTAALFHGIGMKTNIYGENLAAMDVRFVEGPYRARRIRALYPEANVVEVGYPKLDTLLGPKNARPEFDLAAAGLDPAKPTLLYAPTHTPSSFPNMDDRFPEYFAHYNVLVKPHLLSYFGAKRRSHRRKMALWSQAPHVHVASVDEYDPVPFMNVADLLISDISAVLFEFAATDKPIVWCDFLWHHWTRRGPLRYRRWKRLARDVRRFFDIAPHARRFSDLGRVVQDELAHPGRYSEKRRSYVRALVGPTDGRSAERVADYLLAAPPAEELRRSRALAAARS